MRWSELTLGAIIESDGGTIQTGPFGSQLHQHEYRPEGIPVIMPKDISEGRVSEDSVARVSEQTANRLSRHKLRPGTIVLPRRGEISKRAFIGPDQEGWLCGTGCVKIELDADSGLLPEFLYYLMEQGSAVQWLEQHAVGTTMLNLNTQIVGDLPIRYPDREEQRAIIGALSVYKDLIENNRRRIALLEQAARLLYEEWFVRFRFPGHEHVKFINGLPEGWAEQHLAELCDGDDGIQTGPFGSQLHQSDYSDDGIPVVMPKNMIAFRIVSDGIARIPEQTAEKLTRHRLIEGDTVYGRRGDIGRRAFVSEREVGWLCGTGCLRMRPNNQKIDPKFLFDALGAPKTAGTIANRAKGATLPNLNSTILRSVPVLVPPRSMQELYSAQIRPIKSQIETLAAYNEKLGVARDLLLPRLMSGEVEV